MYSRGDEGNGFQKDFIEHWLISDGTKEQLSFEERHYSNAYPGYPLFLSIFIYLGLSISYLKFVQTFLFLIFTLVYYEYVKKFFDKDTAFLTSVIVIVSPIFFLLSINLMTDLLNVLIFIIIFDIKEFENYLVKLILFFNLKSKSKLKNVS